MTENISHKVGNAAYQNKDTHTIYEPIKRGIIEDWEKMEIIWEHIFNELSLETKNVNVLMTDSPFNTKNNRTKMAEYMFEKFKVKSFQVMNTAALSMYSTGKVSGLIAESGEALTYTVPIFEGYALPHAMVKLEVAGQDITKSLINQLEECDIRVANHSEHIRGLKEQMCSISQNFMYDIQNSDDPISEEDRSYELPSGEIIKVNHRQRFKASEIIFNPKLADSSDPGIA
jgi:actin